MRAGEEDPLDGLQRVLDNESRAWAVGFQGWVFTGTSLDKIELPKEILSTATALVGVQVTHTKLPGAGVGAVRHLHFLRAALAADRREPLKSVSFAVVTLP